MKRKKISLTRPMPWLIALAVLLAAIAALVIAAYVRRPGKVTNEFTPAVSDNPTVEETFDGTLKEDVYFQMPAVGYPVYVRAAILVTWKDENGIVYFENPVSGTDYDLTLKLTNDEEETVWEKITNSEGADYYYYVDPVASGGTTSVLIKSCEQLREAPADGYTLSVEIIVQTVQAIGYTDGENGEPEIEAYKDAWGLE